MRKQPDKTLFRPVAIDKKLSLESLYIKPVTKSDRPQLDYVSEYVASSHFSFIYKSQ